MRSWHQRLHSIYLHMRLNRRFPVSSPVGARPYDALDHILRSSVSLHSPYCVLRAVRSAEGLRTERKRGEPSLSFRILFGAAAIEMTTRGRQTGVGTAETPV